MKIEEIPEEERKWIEKCKGEPHYTEDVVHDILTNSADITELKTNLIGQMSEIMTECAQVIQHANAMKDDRICTCKEKHGDKP